MKTETLLDYGISVTRAFFKYYYYIYIVLLMFILATLSAVGGLVFQIVESPPEAKIIDSIIRQRESTIRQLQTKVAAGETKNDVSLFIQLYEVSYIGAIRNGTVIINGQSDPLWTFEGSVYYCVTSFSLVGYGNLAPRTSLGRAIAIIYCGFTIPINSLILAELGEMLLMAFEFIWMKLLAPKRKLEKVRLFEVTNNKNASNKNAGTDYRRANLRCQGNTDTNCHRTYINCHNADTDCRETDTNSQETDRTTSRCNKANCNGCFAQDTHHFTSCVPSKWIKCAASQPIVSARSDHADTMSDSQVNDSENTITEYTVNYLVDSTGRTSTTASENVLCDCCVNNCGETSDFMPWTFAADFPTVHVCDSPASVAPSHVFGNSRMNDFAYSRLYISENGLYSFHESCCNGAESHIYIDDTDAVVNGSCMKDLHAVFCECSAGIPSGCHNDSSTKDPSSSTVSEHEESKDACSTPSVDNEMSTSAICASESSRNDSTIGAHKDDLGDFSTGALEDDPNDSTIGAPNDELGDFSTGALEGDPNHSTIGAPNDDLSDFPIGTFKDHPYDSTIGAPKDDMRYTTINTLEYDLDDGILNNGNNIDDQNVFTCLSSADRSPRLQIKGFANRNDKDRSRIGKPICCILSRPMIKKHANCQPQRPGNYQPMKSANCQTKNFTNCQPMKPDNCHTKKSANCHIKKPANCHTKKSANCQTQKYVYCQPMKSANYHTKEPDIDSDWTVSGGEKGDTSDSGMPRNEVIFLKIPHCNRMVILVRLNSVTDNEYAGLKQVTRFLQVLEYTGHADIRPVLITLAGWNQGCLPLQTDIPVRMLFCVDRRELSHKLQIELSLKTWLAVVGVNRVSQGSSTSSTRRELYQVRCYTFREQRRGRVQGPLTVDRLCRASGRRSGQAQKSLAQTDLSRVHMEIGQQSKAGMVLAKFRLRKYETYEHSVLANSPEHSTEQREIVLAICLSDDGTSLSSSLVCPSRSLLKKLLSNNKIVRGGYLQNRTLVYHQNVDAPLLPRHAEISQKTSTKTVDCCSGCLIFADRDCIRSVRPSPAQSTVYGGCLNHTFRETEPRKQSKNMSRETTGLMKTLGPAQVQGSCTTIKSTCSRLLRLSSNICRQINLAIGRKKSTSRSKTHQSVFSRVKAVAKLVLEREVRMPHPVAMFWLGTPLRGAYIGTRVGNGIRSHLRNPRVEQVRFDRGSQTKRSRKGRRYTHTRRNRNNNVDSDDDDDDDTEESKDGEVKVQESKITSEPVLLTIATTFLFISTGSMFLTKFAENMTYFDSYWFIWISVATIGYGDIVPTDQLLFLGILVYLFIGLCLMSNLISETSLFFSANVSKTRAITTDAVAIIQTRKQLIEIQRRAEKASSHWAILRERVVKKKIPRRLVDESMKYKAGLMSEEREMIRWAYKAYFKQNPKDQLIMPPQLGYQDSEFSDFEPDMRPSIVSTKPDTRYSLVSEVPIEPDAPIPPAPEVKQKEPKLNFFKKMKRAVAKTFRRDKNKLKKIPPDASQVKPPGVEPPAPLESKQPETDLEQPEAGDFGPATTDQLIPE